MKIRATDKLFSLYIRRRDKWTCQRCKRQHEEGSRGLHCSHFFSRRKESTRFYPPNADALCFPCHQLWGHGDGKEEYKKFKINQLGENGFDLLELQSNTPEKHDEHIDILYIKNLLEEL